MNVKKEVAALERLIVNDLRDRYAEVYGESANGRHKQWLVRRMQALEEGGMSERARRGARDIANDADARVAAPKASDPRSPRSEREQDPASRKPAAPPTDEEAARNESTTNSPTAP